VVANDLSSNQLQLLQANLALYKDRITTVEGDMLTLTIPHNSLVAVVGMYSLIHLPRQEQTQLLREISTWIKPGGLFLANFAEEDCEEQVTENWLGEGGWMYWSGWGIEGTMKMIEDAGFEILKKELVSDVADARFLWVLARKQ
jgi:SAM-dependent methyltransferase